MGTLVVNEKKTRNKKIYFIFLKIKEIEICQKKINLEPTLFLFKVNWGQIRGQMISTIRLKRKKIITRESNNVQNQIIRLDSNQLKQLDEKQIILQTNSSNDENENGQGPMKVFIINQPVKNVIQAGNNLIVETETPIKTEDMANGESSSQSGGGAGSGSSGANDQQNYALALNEDENQQQQLALQQPSQTNTSTFDPAKHSFSPEELQVAPVRSKTKKRPVPDSEKDASYWERRKKNNLAA